MKRQLYNTFRNLSQITQQTMIRYHVDVSKIQQLERSITKESSSQRMLEGINELSKYLKHPEYAYLHANKYHYDTILANRAGLPGRHYLSSDDSGSIDNLTR